jgi:hypothetical protein
VTRKEKENSDSWHKDKAVQDNIVESWLCVDCGTNTHPGSPSGPEMRVAFALGVEEVDLCHTEECEIYDVKDAIWKRAGMSGRSTLVPSNVICT